jgi:pimeloyl-ACP methyl ester carboxylesterase
VFVGDQEFLVRQVGPTGASGGAVEDVVLVHGLGGASLAEWFKVGPMLAERYRLTIVDHRSHGLSPKVTDRFEIEDVADDVAGVLGQVGVTNATVVGYSMGGTVAQALAHRHPGIVDRLVLVATFAAHPKSWRWARAVGVAIVRGFERVTGLGSAEFRAGYLLATDAVAIEHARWLWQETHRRDSESGAAASFALLRYDAAEWIGRVAVPTLVVIPLKDQLVPVRWQYELAASIPRAEVVEISGARHEAPLTHGQHVANAICDFLDRNQDSSGLDDREVGVEPS